MFNKSFSDMMTVDVSKYVEKRDGAEYLPWAACKKLLHDNGAELVLFWPVPGPDGSTLRKSDLTFTDKKGGVNRCYEVLVHIQVDEIQWEIAYPVINGNLVVRDDTMSQIRLHNAVRRAFVKGVAERLGLGFNLWLKSDDLPEDEPMEDLSKHSLLKCRQRMQELVSDKIKCGLPFNIIADRLGFDEDSLRAKFALYGELVRLEKAISEMTP